MVVGHFQWSDPVVRSRGPVQRRVLPCSGDPFIECSDSVRRSSAPIQCAFIAPIQWRNMICTIWRTTIR